MFKNISILMLLIILAGCASPAQPTDIPASMIDDETAPEISPSPTPQTPTKTPIVPISLVPGAGVEGVGTIVGISQALFYDLSFGGFDSLWLPHVNEPRHPVSRVDLESGEVVATIPIETADDSAESSIDLFENLFAAAATDEGMWVNNRQAKSLVLIDPETNKIVRQIPMNVEGFLLAADGDDVWVTDPFEDVVLRVDTKTGQIEASIGMNRPTNIAIGGGAVWVLQNTENKVVRINPATNNIEAEIRVASPEDVVFAEDSVWVASGAESGVVRIDPATNSIITKIALRGRPRDVWGLAYGKGAIWVRVGRVCDKNNFVARIDPASNAEAGRMYIQCAYHINFAGDYLWVILDAPDALKIELGVEPGNQPIVRIAPD